MKVAEIRLRPKAGKKRFKGFGDNGVSHRGIMTSLCVFYFFLLRQISIRKSPMWIEQIHLSEFAMEVFLHGELAEVLVARRGFSAFLCQNVIGKRKNFWAPRVLHLLATPLLMAE